MKKHLLAVALSFATVGAAHAFSVDTTGRVENACVFTEVSAGAFGTNAIDPTKLSTNHVGGTGPVVSFTFTGQPTLAITGPDSFSTAPTLGEIVPVFTTVASTTAKGSLTFTGNSASTVYTTGSSDTVNLGLEVSTGSDTNFPAGDFAAATTLTCS